MSTALSKLLRVLATAIVLAAMLVPLLCAQDDVSQAFAVLDGRIFDSRKRPVASVSISLDCVGLEKPLSATSDNQGRFHFASVPASTCTLRAKSGAGLEATEGPFTLHAQERKNLSLLLAKPSSKEASAALEFSDEPRFTVAGVTDATALGGHGSDRVVRNSETISKDTVSLAHESTNPASPASEAAEAELRASLAKNETAATHFQLAEIEERHGQPLEAVKNYQRAAELEPSELHLFGWGAELLLHHAAVPAAEVFTKGQRLYPQSVRMKLGLGAALYAQTRKEEAAKVFLEASDLNPSDPAPYLFLGRLQGTETDLPAVWTEKMKRFVDLYPANATAHCLYAESLARQGREVQDFEAIESHLRTAIALDPRLGSAYLQLGILLVQRKDYPAAVAAFQKAIENTPLPDEAHFRLADVYRRLGQTDQAAKETELFKQISTQKKQQVERERHEIPQFVYTLRGQPSSPSTPPDNH